MLGLFFFVRNLCIVFCEMWSLFINPMSLDYQQIKDILGTILVSPKHARTKLIQFGQKVVISLMVL